jgi:hypothetical protein
MLGEVAVSRQRQATALAVFVGRAAAFGRRLLLVGRSFLSNDGRT